jgi:tRNA-dihydrouridine synthase B
MFRLLLAPLEGYTDAALRTLCYRHGADSTFTEMTHVDSLIRGNRLAHSRIAAHDSTPVHIQLLTGREEQLERFLDGFSSFEGFEGFNLNLSCPSPDVIRQGKGAAMIKRVAKTGRLTSAIRRRGYHVSLKLRLGTNQYEKEMKVYLAAIRGADADFVVVHAKTASDDSLLPADSSVYPECVEAAGGVPIIANGDVNSPEKVEALRRLGVAGVMIGRAAIHDPAIFDSIKNRLGMNDPPKLLPDRAELVREYDTLYSHFGEERYKHNFVRALDSDIRNIIY